MRSYRQFSLLTILTICLFSKIALAQPALRAQLFGEADAAMQAAGEVNASILAPTSYQQAADYYRRADQALSRGRSLDDIQADLVEAVRYFKQATERTEIARVGLLSAYQARSDAEEAKASIYAMDLWREAEDTFENAVRRLESGNMNRARSTGADAEALYREAELGAIENNYFSSTRRLIEEAEDDKVDRYAPITLAKATQLLADAEMQLRSNRYDTDLPRSLARESNYEAQHSIYLAGRIRSVDDRDATMEELLLEAEESFTRIAGNLDFVAELDSGFQAPTETILARLRELQADSETLLQRNEQVAFLENELASMEARLGDESEQRKIQEQIQQRFEQLAQVFTRDEAQVLRRGDEVIVRMGLNFDSGASVIRPEYFSLLRKIQAAIDVFPGSEVEVQGHTDSFGADELNLRLSEDRARAVSQYLLANMDDLGATSITPVGLGETVPLANNETPEGRTRNRRIDLLIRPNLDVLAAALRGL